MARQLRGRLQSQQSCPSIPPPPPPIISTFEIDCHSTVKFYSTPPQLATTDRPLLPHEWFNTPFRAKPGAIKISGGRQSHKLTTHWLKRFSLSSDPNHFQLATPHCSVSRCRGYLGHGAGAQCHPPDCPAVGPALLCTRQAPSYNHLPFKRIPTTSLAQ